MGFGVWGRVREGGCGVGGRTGGILTISLYIF